VGDGEHSLLSKFVRDDPLDEPIVLHVDIGRGFID
jgi:hypothetical protein